MSASVFVLLWVQTHQQEPYLLMFLLPYFEVLHFLYSVYFFSTWNLVVVRHLFYNLPLGLAGIKQLCGPPGPVWEHCRLLTDFCVPSTRDFTIKIVKADKTRGERGGLVQKEACHHSSKDMDTWHTQCHPDKQTPSFTHAFYIGHIRSCAKHPVTLLQKHALIYTHAHT